MEENGWHQIEKTPDTVATSTAGSANTQVADVGAGPVTSGYSQSIADSFAAAAIQYRSLFPTTPFCALPGYWANDLTVLRTSTRTARAGFQAGDRVLAVDGIQIFNLEEFLPILFARSPGNRLTVTIERNAQRSDITTECADGLPIIEAFGAAMDAGSKGRWPECISHIARMERLTAVSSATADLRLTCSEASRLSHNHRPSVGDATLVHEVARLSLEEAAAQPGRLSKIRGRVLAQMTWLDANGYSVLAQDLRESLDQAGGSP